MWVCFTAWTLSACLCQSLELFFTFFCYSCRDVFPTPSFCISPSLLWLKIRSGLVLWRVCRLYTHFQRCGRHKLCLITGCDSLASLWQKLSDFLLFNACTALTEDEGGSPLCDCLLQAVAAPCFSQWYLSKLPLQRGCYTSLELLYCILLQGYPPKWCGTLSCVAFHWNYKASCSQAQPCLIIRALSHLGCKNLLTNVGHIKQRTASCEVAFALSCDMLLCCV